MSLFLEYYITKLKFIISPLRNNLEKKLDKIFFKKYNERIDKDRYFDLERNNISTNLITTHRWLNLLLQKINMKSGA